MGCYINPQNETKEEFLDRVGNHCLISEYLDSMPNHKDSVWVCLVDNGPFTAAAVIFDERELKEFRQRDDLRPKKWYLIPISSLPEGIGHEQMKQYFPQYQ